MKRSIQVTNIFLSLLSINSLSQGSHTAVNDNWERQKVDAIFEGDIKSLHSLFPKNLFKVGLLLTDKNFKRIAIYNPLFLIYREIFSSGNFGHNMNPVRISRLALMGIDECTLPNSLPDCLQEYPSMKERIQEICEQAEKEFSLICRLSKKGFAEKSAASQHKKILMALKNKGFKKASDFLLSLSDNDLAQVLDLKILPTNLGKEKAKEKK